MEPEKSPKEIANSLAKHFSSITNQEDNSKVAYVESNVRGNPLIPQLLEATVAKKN